MISTPTIFRGWVPKYSWVIYPRRPGLRLSKSGQDQAEKYTSYSQSCTRLDVTKNPFQPNQSPGSSTGEASYTITAHNTFVTAQLWIRYTQTVLSGDQASASGDAMVTFHLPFSKYVFISFASFMHSCIHLEKRKHLPSLFYGTLLGTENT